MRGFRLAKKSRSRKGGKAPWKGLFVKRFIFFAALLLLFGGGVVVSLLIYQTGVKAFPVTEIVFYGNTHLSDSELRTLTGISKDESLFSVSPKRVSAKLLQSPWVKEVSIRKDFPHRVLIRILESSSFAILEMKGRAFLVDEKGKMLEEMKDAVPFLPVITADPFKNRDNFIEALNLAKVVKDSKIATERNRVEIIADKGPESISLVMDNMVIRMGQGDYERKLNRLLALEDEIKKRSIAVDYVDLRFANRVVVKPISEVVR